MTGELVKARRWPGHYVVVGGEKLGRVYRRQGSVRLSAPSGGAIVCGVFWWVRTPDGEERGPYDTRRSAVDDLLEQGQGE